jgi:3-mercaptopyruvate sulfurtransferase SseA
LYNTLTIIIIIGFGHRGRVAILNGGFNAWCNQEFAPIGGTESNTKGLAVRSILPNDFRLADVVGGKIQLNNEQIDALKYEAWRMQLFYKRQPALSIAEYERDRRRVERRRYVAQPFDTSLLRTTAQIEANIESRRELVVDARSAARFYGQVDEPRREVARGRIPHSINVPFDAVSNRDGCVEDSQYLTHLFRNAGVGYEPIVVSCGSGVSACAVGFAAYVSGVSPTIPPLYDGSWTEYALTRSKTK